MNGDENPFTFSPIADKSFPKVQVLVVDGDSSCLKYITEMFNMLNYQVTPAKDPFEALYLLKMKEVSFDLVIADVYTPLMNGVVLQQKIESKFSIPVVLMSKVSDKQQLSKETGLKEDTLILNKPPNLNQVQNLWRYALIRMKAKNNFKGKKGRAKKTPTQKATTQQEKSTTNEKGLAIINVDDVPSDSTAIVTTKEQPKTKVIWTSALHNRFLEAMKAIGFDRAVPKRIEEHMNVKGLNRKHISSHLQKYRSYMKRIYEECMKIAELSDFTWQEFPDLIHNSFLLNYATAMFMKELNEDKRRTRYKKRGPISRLSMGNNNDELIKALLNNSRHGNGSSSSSYGLGNLHNNPNQPIIPSASSSSSSSRGLADILYYPNQPVTPYASSSHHVLGGGFYNPIQPAIAPSSSSHGIAGSLYNPNQPIIPSATSSHGLGGSLYNPIQPVTPYASSSHGLAGSLYNLNQPRLPSSSHGPAVSLYSPIQPVVPSSTSHGIGGSSLYNLNNNYGGAPQPTTIRPPGGSSHGFMGNNDGVSTQNPPLGYGGQANANVPYYYYGGMDNNFTSNANNMMQQPPPPSELYDFMEQTYGDINNNYSSTSLGRMWNDATSRMETSFNRGPQPEADLSDFLDDLQPPPNVAADLSEFLKQHQQQQQLPAVVNASSFVQQQPPVTNIVTDSVGQPLPSNDNVVTTVEQQPQPVSDAMNNMVNSVVQHPQVGFSGLYNLGNMSTGDQFVVATTDQFAGAHAVGNQQNNSSSSSNDQPAPEMQDNGFLSGTPNQVDDIWAPYTNP